MDRNEFGSFLKKVRSDRGYTLRELSNITGISFSHLSKIERGEYQPSKTTVLTISSSLDLDENELLILAGYAPQSESIKNLFPNLTYKQSEKILEENVIKEEPDYLVKVPIIGEVKAGYNLLAEENVIGYNFVPSSEVNNGQEYFYLKVTGESMIKLGITEGTIVKVKKQNFVDSNGKIAIVITEDGEVTIKRVFKYDDSVVLQAENDSIPPRIFKPYEIKILGQVVKAEIEF
ncbi:LexA family protein [Paraliobacillus ryukyuensis]|uniref:LexA family protein n=1 Tax=Paraliobacillus ryukyuensis TaxID=200904 RepID=UPI0009A61D58|nr:XRE family transcriptional regulator [Paraliobacillus ryukyuensis]